MDILSLMPVRAWSVFQNLEMTSLSWSDMISSGRLFLQYHFSKKISASWLAVKVEVEGMICISEPKRLVKVMIVSKPLSDRRGPMKSMATESQCESGIVKGCRGPIGFDVLIYFVKSKS